MGDLDWAMAFLELKDEINKIATEAKAGAGEDHLYPQVDAAVKKYYDRWVKPFASHMKDRTDGRKVRCTKCNWSWLTHAQTFKVTCPSCNFKTNTVHELMQYKAEEVNPSQQSR